MGRRLYVGNLPYKTTDEDLMSLFSRAGAVDNVRVMRDQATGRARGFAFVEMVNDEDAQKAIDEFHQYEYDGRALVVNEVTVVGSRWAAAGIAASPSPSASSQRKWRVMASV